MVRVYVGNKFGKQKEVFGSEKESALKNVSRTPSKKDIKQIEQEKKEIADKKSEQKYNPQTQSTINQLKSGEITSRDQAYLVGGEVAISEKTALAVAQYKNQQGQERVNKHNKKVMETVQENTRERMSQEWSRKKAEIEKEEPQQKDYNPYAFPPEKRTSPEIIDKSNPYFTPERKKSPQETIDKTSLMDWKPFVKFDDQAPSKEDINSFNKAKTNQERETAKQDLLSSKNSMSWEWSSPIQTARSFSELWSKHLDVRKQDLQYDINDLGEKRSQAVNDFISLSGSSESINPMTYNSQIESYQTEIKNSETGFKAPIIAMTGTTFISVAKGGKSVFIDMPLHPRESAKNIIMTPFNIPEIIVDQGKAILKDPVGAPVELATTMWSFGKVTEGAMRIIKPKVTETPIKAKSIKSLKTMRRDQATGKIKTDQQIQIETEMGTPKERFFWENSKIKPRKNLKTVMDRTTRSDFKGSELLEGESNVKGSVKFKDQASKIKLSKDSTTELNPPKKIYDLDQGMTGKTGAGVKLDGTTGKLKDSFGLERSVKNRKGYTRRIKQSYEELKSPEVSSVLSDVLKPSKSEIVTKEFIKNVAVKPSSKTVIKQTGTKTYRSKSLSTGDLILEEQMSGKFVKRGYKRNPKTSFQDDPIVTDGIYKDGDFFTIQAKKSTLKSLRDENIQTLESGKKANLGKRPMSPELQDFSDSLKGSSEELGFSQGGKSGSQQKVVLKEQELTKFEKYEPVIDVLTTNEKVSGINIPVIVTNESKQTPKGSNFLPKAIQESLLQTPEITDPKEDQAIIDIIETGQEEDLKPIFDTYTEPTTKEKSSLNYDTITEDDQTNKEKEISKPVIDTKIDLKQDQIPIPIFHTDQIPVSDFKFGQEINFNDDWTEPTTPRDKKSKDPFDDEFFSGFDVFVKRKGKFEKFNQKGSLSKEDALMFGALEVDRSPSASFKLVESSSPMAIGSRSKIKNKMLLDHFYEKEGTFIEKSKYRIDTPEEVRGISHLGNIAKQTGNFFKEAKRKLPKMMEEFHVPSMTGNHKKSKGGGFQW